MKRQEAMDIIERFYQKSNPNDDEIFLYIESLTYLIEEEKDNRAMLELGGYYYGQRKFDLALKYYEMASTYGNDYADECLGYIWYYGRTGIKDYKKAFEYFSKAKERGRIVAAYKLADMYKNGYYVEKDHQKYTRIIESLYPEIKKTRNLEAPLPEIFTRLARIRKEEGKIEEAISLYQHAKWFLAQRISFHPFFGNLNIMKWLVEDLYTLTEVDEENLDLFDFYYVLKTPHTIKFKDDEEVEYVVESMEEDGNIVIHFGNKWYRDVDEFFKKACIDGDKLTSLYFVLGDFQVVKE